MGIVSKKNGNVTASAASNKGVADNGFALTKTNFILLAIGFVVIVAGLACMIGSSTGTAFDPSIFSFRRITLGPVVTVIGFLFEIVAILWIPKTKAAAESKPE